MQVSEHEKEQIRASTDIVELAGRYTKLRQAGREFKGLCPCHAETTPSFTVSPEKQSFNCFGCPAGGDVFSLIMQAENLKFPEAVERLAAEAGISLERDSQSATHQKPLRPKATHQRPKREPEEPLVPIPDTKRLNAFLEQAQQTLWTRADLQERWLGKRNLKLEAVKEYGIGFMEGPIGRPVIGVEARDFWVLPVCDCRGDIKAVKLHIEDEEFRKEQGTKSRWACFGKPHSGNGNKPRHAYQTLWPPPEWWFEAEEELAAIMEHEGKLSRQEAEEQSGWKGTCLYLLPGELKAMRWISAGKAATSITRGEGMKARDWTPGMIARLKTHRLVVVYDDDEAGRRFRDEAAKALSKHVKEFRTFTHGRRSDEG